MVCPKCQSTNVNVQVVNEMELKKKHKSVAYWIFVGWWLQPILWLFLTLPMLIIRLFGHKKQKIKNTQKTVCICQNCGNRWEINQ